MPVNIQSLVDHLYMNGGMSREIAHKSVKMIFEVIAKKIEEGESVKIKSFGTFQAVLLPPKKMKGLGKEFDLNERVKIKFRTSRVLHDKLNNVTIETGKSPVLKFLQNIQKQKIVNKKVRK